MPASLVGLDSALREAMNGIFRLSEELRSLGSAEAEAVALAPKGCPDLRAIIGQLGPWRDEVYARVHGIKIAQDGASPPSSRGRDEG